MHKGTVAGRPVSSISYLDIKMVFVHECFIVRKHCHDHKDLRLNPRAASQGGYYISACIKTTYFMCISKGVISMKVYYNQGKFIITMYEPESENVMSAEDKVRQ